MLIPLSEEERQQEERRLEGIMKRSPTGSRLYALREEDLSHPWVIDAVPKPAQRGEKASPSPPLASQEKEAYSSAEDAAPPAPRRMRSLDEVIIAVRKDVDAAQEPRILLAEERPGLYGRLKAWNAARRTAKEVRRTEMTSMAAVVEPTPTYLIRAEIAAIGLSAALGAFAWLGIHKASERSVKAPQALATASAPVATQTPRSPLPTQIEARRPATGDAEPFFVYRDVSPDTLKVITDYKDWFAIRFSDRAGHAVTYEPEMLRDEGGLHAGLVAKEEIPLRGAGTIAYLDRRNRVVSSTDVDLDSLFGKARKRSKPWNLTMPLAVIEYNDPAYILTDADTMVPNDLKKERLYLKPVLVHAVPNSIDDVFTGEPAAGMSENVAAAAEAYDLYRDRSSASFMPVKDIQRTYGVSGRRLTAAVEGLGYERRGTRTTGKQRAQRQEAVGRMLTQGMVVSEIADATGYSASTVRRDLKAIADSPAQT